MSNFRERLRRFPSWLLPLVLLSAIATGVLHFLWVYVWSNFWGLALWEAIFWSAVVAWIVGAGSIGAHVIGTVLSRAYRRAVDEQEQEQRHENVSP